MKEEETFYSNSLVEANPEFINAYVEDTSIYIVEDDMTQPIIRFYSSENSRIPTSEIVLSHLGPNGVGEASGIHFQSFDSIYVLNSTEATLFLVNSRGDVITKWRWDDIMVNSDYEYVSTPYLTMTSPAFLSKNAFNTIALPTTSSTKRSTYENGKVNFTINLKDGKADFTINYPATYAENMYGSFWGEISRSQTHDDRVVYSFGADPFVHTANSEELLEDFYAGTIFFNSPLTTKSFKNFWHNVAASAGYGGILYDKYRNLYYRIAFGELEPTSEYNLKQAFYYKPFSIIILDENYTVIGETKMPTGTYSYKNVFVGKRGLYILKYNPNRGNNRKGQLLFSIYEPVSIDTKQHSVSLEENAN